VIHIVCLGRILIENAHVRLWHLLHALQDFEAAAPALAFRGIGRIGDELQFVEHKLRHTQYPIQKVRFANVRDAAIDQNTGVEKLHGLERGGLRVCDSSYRGNLQLATSLPTKHQPQISQCKQGGIFEERLCGFWHIRSGNNERYEKGRKHSQDCANGTSYQPAYFRSAEPQLGQQNPKREKEADARRRQAAQPEGRDLVTECGYASSEEHPREVVLGACPKKKRCLFPPLCGN
jgi:hypothetical protein